MHFYQTIPQDLRSASESLSVNGGGSDTQPITNVLRLGEKYADSISIRTNNGLVGCRSARCQATFEVILYDVTCPGSDIEYIFSLAIILSSKLSTTRAALGWKRISLGTPRWKTENYVGDVSFTYASSFSDDIYQRRKVWL